jgi:hypothetical protein
MVPMGHEVSGQLAVGSWQLAKEETKKRGNEEEKKKESGTNGKYPYGAWYDDCPHIKNFCGVQAPLRGGAKQALRAIV